MCVCVCVCVIYLYCKCYIILSIILLFSQPGMVHSPTPDDLYFEVGIGVEILEDDGKGKNSPQTLYAYVYI